MESGRDQGRWERILKGRRRWRLLQRKCRLVCWGKSIGKAGAEGYAAELVANGEEAGAGDGKGWSSKFSDEGVVGSVECSEIPVTSVGQTVVSRVRLVGSELIEKKWDGSSTIPGGREWSFAEGSATVAFVWAGKRFSSKTTFREG
jgi:hypothetical protein